MISHALAHCVVANAQPTTHLSVVTLSYHLHENLVSGPFDAFLALTGTGHALRTEALQAAVAARTLEWFPPSPCPSAILASVGRGESMAVRAQNTQVLKPVVELVAVDVLKLQRCWSTEPLSEAALVAVLLQKAFFPEATLEI